MKFMHPVHPVLASRDFAVSRIEAPLAEGSVPCPFCRKSVLESAAACRHCGTALHEVEEENRGRGMWVLAIIGLVAAMTFSFQAIQ